MRLKGQQSRGTGTTWLRLPVDFPVKTIAPEDAVVGDIQVQSDGVLLRGHHLAVVPLHQVDTSDLVPVGEEQVRAFTCSGRRRGLRALLQRHICILSAADLSRLQFTTAVQAREKKRPINSLEVDRR